MPAVSEKQRRFMALTHAYQLGKVDKKKVGNKVKDAAKSMSSKETRDFMHKKASAFLEGYLNKTAEGKATVRIRPVEAKAKIVKAQKAKVKKAC